MRYNQPSEAIELAPNLSADYNIRGITVVNASKPLKQLGFVSRQVDIGDALNEHNICSPTTGGPLARCSGKSAED